MPMGIVSDEDFETERTRLNTTIKENKVEIEDIKRGRGEKKETPDIIRESVARSAINGEGTGFQIAKAFGVSESSVSAYKVGATSTTSYDKPDDKLIASITSHKERIGRKSRRVLLTALNSITEDKLKGAKAVDLAQIAKNMAAIVTDMEPKVVLENQQNNVQFVFMAPRVKSIDDYKIIDVSD